MANGSPSGSLSLPRAAQHIDHRRRLCHPRWTEAEINHAIYWAYGMDDADREERIVGTMATAWLQVWRDNPSLVQMLADSIGWQNVQTAPTEEGGKEQL